MQSLLSVLFFLFVLPQVGHLSLFAQLCGGNLGENIFEAGDFGSGTANLISVDPGIAPGYLYTTNVPPNDGFYTITNNTGAWPGLFPTWLAIQDNGPEPNGYMMVVNASFSPGLFYEQEIDGLCENTLYLFSADVINLIRSGTTGHISPDVSFLLNGQERFTTGNISQSESWDTYGFTFVTEPGQTSVTLSLRNNAPGGIGNDLAIDNISFRACGPESLILPLIPDRICEDGETTTLSATILGDQYDQPAIQWQRSLDEGQSWEDIPGENDFDFIHTDLSSGFYYYRYLLANGPSNLASAKCRVVSNVKIVEVVPKEWSLVDTICTGSIYRLGNSIYEQSGTYQDSLISSIGCDSIVTLELTVLPDPGIELTVGVDQPFCAGDFGGFAVNETLNGNPPYQLVWQNASDTISFTDSVGMLPTGTYEVVATDRYGCRGIEMIDIGAAAPFSIELGPDRSVRLGEEVSLDFTTTEPITGFDWQPLPEDCPAICRPANFAPRKSASYLVIAVSERGCTAVDSVFVEVLPLRQVYIPNAFSPNFDGVNDAFAPIVISPNVERIQRFQVFNRWGGLVYEQTDWLPAGISDGWDGRIGERMAPLGVYAYVAEIRFLDGAVIRYAGDVTLLP